MNAHDMIELPPLPRPQVPRIDADIDLMDIRRLALWCEKTAKDYAIAAIEADRTRQGDSAKVLAELVALIPLADTLNASASCQDLIDYFKGVIADSKRRGEPVRCAVCGTHEVSVAVTCQNSSCPVYVNALRAHEENE